MTSQATGAPARVLSDLEIRAAAARRQTTPQEQEKQRAAEEQARQAKQAKQERRQREEARAQAARRRAQQQRQEARVAVASAAVQCDNCGQYRPVVRPGRSAPRFCDRCRPDGQDGSRGRPRRSL